MSLKIAPRTESGGRTLRLTRSLAFRLTAWYALFTFLIFLAGSAVVYLSLRQMFAREADEFLNGNIQMLASKLQEDPNPESAIITRMVLVTEFPSRQYARIHFRIMDPAGETLLESREMPSNPPREAPLLGAQAELDGWDVLTPNGRRFRCLAAEVPSGNRRYVVQVACDLAHQEDILRGFRTFLGLVLAVAFPVCGCLGYFIARRGLARVKRIAALARHVRSTTLNERIPVKDLPYELEELAATFNEMLDRLEESFARLTRFSADLAHELRTPIHNLRGEVEVSLGKIRSPEEYRETLHSVLEECERLSRFVDRLLFLARADYGEARLDRAQLDAGRELATVKEFFEAQAAEAKVALSVSAPAGLSFRADRELFQLAISNLVSNALDHTPPEGRIALAAEANGEAVCFQVSDTGSGIPEEHLQKVFDRFYRVDASRASNRGGMGLGLSIVKAIAQLHRAQVGIVSHVEKGTSVEIRFPKEK